MYEINIIFSYITRDSDLSITLYAFTQFDETIIKQKSPTYTKYVNRKFSDDRESFCVSLRRKTLWRKNSQYAVKMRVLGEK